MQRHLSRNENSIETMRPQNLSQIAVSNRKYKVKDSMQPVDEHNFENKKVFTPSLAQVFQEGVAVDFMTYPSDDRDHRVQWNVLAHDEDNNKFAPLLSKSLQPHPTSPSTLACKVGNGT